MNCVKISIPILQNQMEKKKYMGNSMDDGDKNQAMLGFYNQQIRRRNVVLSHEAFSFDELVL